MGQVLFNRLYSRAITIHDTMISLQRLNYEFMNGYLEVSKIIVDNISEQYSSMTYKVFHMRNAYVTIVDERIQVESKSKLSLKQTEPLKSGKLSSKNDVRPLSQDIRTEAATL